MLAKVTSCALVGLDGVLVDVEVDNTRGMPGLTVVGLPDVAVRESKDRVRAAIKNCGMTFPNQRLTVNLAPADLRKEGPAYDLPIALGVLAASGQVPADTLEGSLFIGELSLDGSVRHVRGVLSFAYTAREIGLERIFVPAVSGAEAALIPGIDVYPVDHLISITEHLLGLDAISPYDRDMLSTDWPQPEHVTDFSEVKGQDHVKRALEIAAAGNHNVLMVGAPGTGKTLLARALPGILPKLTIDEMLAVTRIYSVAGMLPSDTPLIRHRPFRAPHHTISHAGLVGGGQWPRPGEISLSHRGLLFLDELAEFPARSLETLRQPLEDKHVTLSRAAGTVTFPANFILIGASNPCPCGYYGDSVRACTCSSSAITRYNKRISGPLLDRIDIHIEVPRVEYEKLAMRQPGEASQDIQARVQAARDRQTERFTDADNRIISNADMGPREVRELCLLDAEGETLMGNAMRQMQLSARAYHRILKLARTAADLEGADDIQVHHLAEALQYRVRYDVG
jgi:magnesium chelatase family protein